MTRSAHRRPGCGVNRRSGFRGVGGGSAPAWTPASVTTALLWWDPTTVTGAVASQVDRIASVSAANATGTEQPTASATAIGSAYAGVTSDGGDILTAAGAGAVLSGKTTLTVVMAMVDATTAASIALEHTASAVANNGGFYIAPNDSLAGRLRVAVRGATGATIRYITEDLSTVKVVSCAIDFATAGAGAVPWIRVNGTSVALTTSASASTAGSAANASLQMFARTALVAPYAGTLGDIVIRESIAEDADLDLIERYIGTRVGLTW